MPGSAGPKIRADKVTLITRDQSALSPICLLNWAFAVEVSGLEPPTSTLRTWRSTS